MNIKPQTGRRDYAKSYAGGGIVSDAEIDQQRSDAAAERAEGAQLANAAGVLQTTDENGGPYPQRSTTTTNKRKRRNPEAAITAALGGLPVAGGRSIPSTAAPADEPPLTFDENPIQTG